MKVTLQTHNCHIIELGGWLNVAAEHDWGTAGGEERENYFIEGRALVLPLAC